MAVFFVAGTDTNVGKTIASRAILQAMQNKGAQIVGYKPIATGQNEPIYTDVLQPQSNDYGNQDNHDVLVLMDSTKENVNYQDVNSYSFEHTMPMITPEGAYIRVDKINADLSRLTQKYDNVLVEGSFGWHSPMISDLTFGDWALQHKMPVVLVVGIKEGCINHALVTAQSIENMGLPLVGWIANRINPGLGHYAEIIELLKQKISAPMLGKIPYIHKPEIQELGHYIIEMDRLLALK